MRPRPGETLVKNLLDQFSQLPFWFHADSCLLSLAILENDQGRDAPYSKAPGSFRVVVNIELGTLDAQSPE